MERLTQKTRYVSAKTLVDRERLMCNIEDACKLQIQWWQTSSVQEYRRKRAEGDGFPKPFINEAVETATIKATKGHEISLRIIRPQNKANATILHFHAGGFVIGSTRSYDAYLLRLATSVNMNVASVEYRLAPEHPYPAAYDDALDATIFALSDEGKKILGAPLKVLAGESAGGCIAIWVALALRERLQMDVRSRISAIVASYPVCDLSLTPSCVNHGREAVLSSDSMRRFVEVAFPGMSTTDLKRPEVSPIYSDLAKMPPALCLCGTEDPLVDDSMMMSWRWASAGNDSALCFIPGAWHGFTILPAGEITDDGHAEIQEFLKRYT